MSSAVDDSILPFHPRKRRKRARTSAAVKERNKSISSNRRSTLSLEDDKAFVFGDNKTDHSRTKVDHFSLPAHLEERRVGKWNRNRNAWKARAICYLKESVSQRRHWRPFAARRIQFTSLGTPLSDAVLALHRCGSFVLALGQNDGENSFLPKLALRFYGNYQSSRFGKRTFSDIGE